MKVQALPDAAMLLSAGASRRMGRPKGLLRLGDQTLMERHIEALSAWAGRVVVVLGRDAPTHARALPRGVQWVHNPRWATTWPADSLRLALESADVEGAAWITPVDTPPAHASTLKSLLAAGAPAVPVNAVGRGGHPVLVDAELVMQLRARAPDGGLRTVLGRAARVRVPDPLVSMDFDTPEAWEKFLALWARHRPSGSGEP